MFRKFLFWFICFGASHIIQNIGFAGQGKAFMYIYLGLDIIYLLVVIFTGYDALNENEKDQASYSFKEVLLAFPMSWVSSKLFDIDFYLAYQIMTFGRCWYINTSKKRNP